MKGSVNYPILISENEETSQDEYVYIRSKGQNDLFKVNASLNERKGYTSVFNVLKDVFLPRGYPNSVSKDYLNYQIWDTLQAFCSTITGTLATKSVLKGIGVGDSTATSTSAAVTWVLKDGIGLLAKIAFAWGIGSGLDRDCKKWRMFADIMNDIAFFIELIILANYSEYSIYILCFSTSLKGLVGIAGGATRAAITQHQAIQENMADVSAKDGSQETCVNLIASIVGVVILSYFENSSIVWYWFFVLAFLHLYANYKAVKSLNFNYFNNERFLIFLKAFLMSDILLSPQEINKKESVFIGFGENGKSVCGFNIKIGCSLEKIANGDLLPRNIKFLAHMYKLRKFMIFIHHKQKTIYIFLDAKANSKDTLEAYFHAVMLGIGISCIKNNYGPPWNNATKDDLDNLKPAKATFSKPINSLYDALVKKMSTEINQDDIEIFDQMTIDQITSEHVADCLQKASMIGWDTDKNQIPVDKWRTNWGENIKNDKKD